MGKNFSPAIMFTIYLSIYLSKYNIKVQQGLVGLAWFDCMAYQALKVI